MSPTMPMMRPTAEIFDIRRSRSRRSRELKTMLADMLFAKDYQESNVLRDSSPETK